MNELDLEILVKRHLNEVYNFIYRLVGDETLASDLTQETWIKVWRHLKRYDSTQPFKPWLFKIAKNTTLDFWRKRQELPFSTLDQLEEGYEFAETIADESELPDQLLSRAEVKAELKAALAALPALDREIILLHQADDLTFNQIGEIFGQSLNTIKSRYRRAMLALRDLLSAPN